MNWSELVTRLQGYSENDSLTTAVIEYLVENAESRIYREVNLLTMKQLVSASFTDGDPFITLPARALEVRSMQAVSGNQRSLMIVKDQAFINEFWPDRTATGMPAYYARITDDTLLVAPTPTSGLDIELSYTSRPDPMTETNTNTWLGDNAPAVLFAATMIELLKYQKGESTQIENASDKPSFWENEYMVLVNKLKSEQEARLWTDEYRRGVQSF